MSVDKENSIKRSKSNRKSGVLSKQILVDSDNDNTSGLTNEFAGYLDCVRTLQSENENLKSEKEQLIATCENEICTIKSTYGNEIDALRKALDESTKEKCTVEYHNDKLLEENNNLKIKFARKIDAINDLEKKYDEAELCLIKNRKCIEQFESIRQENEDLHRSTSLLQEQLKTEVCRRTEAENHALTLSDEIEFMKKVNASNNNVIRENSLNLNNKSESFYHAKFDEEMKAMREELTYEFDQYKEDMEEIFKQKLEELSLMNAKLNEKCTKIYNEKKSLQSENDSAHAEISVLETQLASISARDAKYNEIIAKMTNEHDEFIKDILEENNNLKNKLQEATAEVGVLLNEKIANDKETYIFRSMLKGEKSRFNLSDVKKRKLSIDDGSDNEITAWSKENMRIFCDENYNGNYIQILNDGPDDINLNEWKIEIRSESDQVFMYTFPDRVLKAGTLLRMWSEGEDVTEDECNMIMNAVLPLVNTMSCRLSNDMEELEASFEVKKGAVKRKILKVSAKKQEINEKCSIM